MGAVTPWRREARARGRDVGMIGPSLSRPSCLHPCGHDDGAAFAGLTNLPLHFRYCVHNHVRNHEFLALVRHLSLLSPQ